MVDGGRQHREAGGKINAGERRVLSIGFVGEAM